MVVGAVSLALAGVLALLNRKPAPSVPVPASYPKESAFLGRSGYVIGLPPGYATLQEFKDAQKRVEVVHFFKAGTDPTSLLDEGLYGELGIVRLEVSPNDFSPDLNGLAQLTELVKSRALRRGEKFTVKNLALSPLRGVQFNFDAPFARVEAYILGQKVLYSFMAGQDDEIYRALINSLRDAQSEN